MPGWQRLDPGRLDTIEVGAPAPAPGTSGASLVPFRIVDVDGAQVAGVATVGGRRLRPPRHGGQLGPERRPGLPGSARRAARPIERISARAWLAALGVAAILSLLAVGVVVLVRRTAPRAPDVT